MHLKKKKSISFASIYYDFVKINIKRGLKNKSILNFLFLMKNLKLIFKKDPQFLLSRGFDSLQLLVYIYKRKIGSRLVSIPLYWNELKKLKKGFLLFYKIVAKRNERLLRIRFLKEFTDIILRRGATIKARNQFYLLASENKTYLRYVLGKSKIKEKKDLPSFSQNYINYYTSIKNSPSFVNFYEKKAKTYKIINQS